MKKHERLPFEVIVSATEGDPEAIATVMNFYDGYISKLCLRKLYDEHGNVCMVVDADLKNRVQTAGSRPCARYVREWSDSFYRAYGRSRGK